MKYETRCVKIKLKPNSLHKVNEWAKVIDQRKDEALATLEDEGVIFESAFLDQTIEGDFLIYVMKAKNFENVKEAYKRSEHDIDKYHRSFMEETYEHRQELETLIDLENFE